MKTLQVFDFFTPYGGGTPDVIYKLSKGLQKNGHQVTICTSDTKAYKSDQRYIDSLKGVDVKVFHCWSNLFGFYVIPSIMTKVDVRGYDVVHFHCFRSFQNVVLSQKCRKYNLPYVVDAHGSTLRLGKGVLKAIYDNVFTIAFVEGTSKFIAETSVGVEEYKSFGIPQDKIATIHVPFDIDEFEQLPLKGDFKSKYGISGKHIIMFLGRLHQTKGLDFLVESFHSVCQTRVDVMLVIVGNDDGYRDTLEERVKALGLSDKVLFIGFLSGKEKLEALVDADVLVQPSPNEQGARPSFEAILCDTPVIVVNGTGAGRDIGEIDAGYLVDYDNLFGMSQMMQYVIDNPVEARVKTQRGKEWVKTNLSLDNQVEKYERLYREVIG